MTSSATRTGWNGRTALWAYFAAVVLTGLGVLLTANHADLDLWGRMSVGALWEQTGHFPYRDPFSYTAPNAEWLDHEWGSGVVFYRIFMAWGDSGLFALKLGLFLLTLAIVHVQVLRRLQAQDGHAIRLRAVLLYAAVLGMTLGAVPTGFASTIRCQTFSYLFYVMTLCLLESYRVARNPYLPWAIPPLMLAWVNLHGGIAYGFFAVGVYTAWTWFEGRRRDARVLLLVMLAAFAALFANPYGARLPVFLVRAWSLRREFILEWWDVFRARGTVYGLVYYTYFLLLLALAVAAWRRTPRSFPGALVLILATGTQGIRHVKLMPFFVLTALFLTPALVPPAPPTSVWRFTRRWRLEWLALRMGPTALIALAAAACVAMMDAAALQVRVPIRSGRGGQAYPVGAAEYLERAAPPVNVWCPFETGEFLAWRLYPTARVSIDGRYEEVYPPAVVNDYCAFAFDGDVSRASRYPTTHLLLPVAATALAVRVVSSGQWHPAYEDDAYRLYTRRAPEEVVHAASGHRALRLNDFRGDRTRFTAAHCAWRVSPWVR